MGNPDKYIPAMGYTALAGLYDPLIALFMREQAFKSRLIRFAHIQPGQRVLDLGCGTATLTLMIKRAHPDSQVVGLDGDEGVLGIARHKVARAGADIRLERGLAFDMPYVEASFDRVLSSLVIHHISRANKRRTFAEIGRILKPGGELHIVDFGRPRDALAWLTSALTRHADSLADNLAGRLPDMMREAGLVEVAELDHFFTMLGTLAFYRARKPG